MTTRLSLALLCQKRKSLSPAVLGLFLPCSVPAAWALCASTQGSPCFPEDLLCSPRLQHSSGWKEPPRSPLFPCRDKQVFKIKGYCPAVPGTQQVPSCVSCPSPEQAVPLLSRHRVPHAPLSPTAM